MCRATLRRGGRNDVTAKRDRPREEHETFRAKKSSQLAVQISPAEHLPSRRPVLFSCLPRASAATTCVERMGRRRDGRRGRIAGRLRTRSRRLHSLCIRHLGGQTPFVPDLTIRRNRSLKDLPTLHAIELHSNSFLSFMPLCIRAWKEVRLQGKRQSTD